MIKQFEKKVSVSISILDLPASAFKNNEDIQNYVSQIVYPKTSLTFVQKYFSHTHKHSFKSQF